MEIDPFVVELSDRYFGKIRGPVIITDGRAYLAQAPDKAFDYVFVDAFDSLASVPPQLITREFFADVSRVLMPEGRMIYNFIGVPHGERSNSYRAISATINSVFSDARLMIVDESSETLSNILLIASNSSMQDLDFPHTPSDGRVLTDDLNPAEIYFEQARAGYYFH